MTDPNPADGQPGDPEGWRAPSASTQPPFFTTPPGGPVPPSAPAAVPAPANPYAPQANPYAAPQAGGPTMPDPRFGTPPAMMPDPRFGTPAVAQAFPPPGYPPPYAGAPPSYGYGVPVRRFQAVDGLGTATLVLGAVLVLSSVLRALTAPSAAHAYSNAILQGRDPLTITTAYQMVSGLELVCLPLWIVASVWLSRARSNAELLAPAQLRRSGVWCWLSWIVPIVALWFPKQVVDDTWRVTGGTAGPNSPARPRSTALMWGLWITYNVLFGLAGTSIGGGYDNPTGQSSGFAGNVALNHVHPALEFVMAVVGIAAFALWVPVVRGITAAQRELVSRF